MIFTKAFLLEALERAIKTAAQGMAMFWTVGAATNLFDLEPVIVGGAALSGFLFSILTSVASAPFGRENSPSLVKGEPGLDEPASTPN